MYSNTLPQRSLWPIVLGVLFFHALACVGTFFLAPPVVTKPANTKKLLVRTVKLSPNKKQETYKPKEMIATAEPVSAPVAPQPEVKEIPVAPPAPVAVPVPEPTVKKEIKKDTPAPSKEVVKETPKTVSKPKVEAKVEAKAPVKPVAKAQATVTKPVEKKETKPVVKSTPAPVSAKNTEMEKKRELLAKAMGSLSKVETKPSKTVSSSQRENIEMPKEMGAFHADTLSFEGSDHGLNIKELGYRDELAIRLRLLLKLPEYGIVKLRLILARSGKVTKVEIVSSGSDVNRKYIEKIMPTLSFPSFGDNFSKEQSHTFPITLSSD